MLYVHMDSLYVNISIVHSINTSIVVLSALSLDCCWAEVAEFRKRYIVLVWRSLKKYKYYSHKDDRKMAVKRPREGWWLSTRKLRHFSSCLV